MKKSQILMYTPKILPHLIKGEILVFLIPLKIDVKAIKFNDSNFKDDFRLSQFMLILRHMKSGPQYAYSQYELCISA